MSLFVPKLTAAAIAILALTGLQQVHAQSNGDEDESNGSETVPSPGPASGIGGENSPGTVLSGSRRGRPGSATTTTTPAKTATSSTATLNAPTTATIVASLNESTSYCKQIEAKEYVIDCLAERLEEVNRQIDGLEGYEEVSKVLADTAENLNQIARQNRSSSLPPAWFSTQGETPIPTERALIPVDEGKLESAMDQALTVIKDAEATLLLRSSEESADRASQYQRIASAIGSNKVLLRSTG